MSIMGRGRTGRRALLRAGSVLAATTIAGCMQPLLEEETDSTNSSDEGAHPDDGTVVDFTDHWELASDSAVDTDQFQSRLLTVDGDLVYAASNRWIVGLDPASRRVEQTIDLEEVVDRRQSERTRNLVIEDGRLYLSTALSDGDETTSILYELTPDGEVWWAHEVPHTWIGTVSVDGNRVFVGSFSSDTDESTFEVLNTDGEVVFSHHWPPEEHVNSISDSVVHDGIVYLSGSSLGFDGETVFETEDRYGFSLENGLSLHDDTVYSTGRRFVRATDLESKTELFEAEIDEGRASPAVAEDLVVAGGHSGLYGFDRESGAERWHVRTTDHVDEPPAILDGVAYALDESNLVYGVHLDSGDLVYDDESPRADTELLRAVGGQLVFAGSTGLSVVDPEPS